MALPGVAAAACTPRKNLEAIIDDSASLQGTDPQVKRGAGLELIMATPGNEKLRLGAIEFGEQASPIFGPGPIAPNRSAFAAALHHQLHGDDFGTSYDAAFALARTHDPAADARLFLTDGGQNTGAYGNGHLGDPPTHVIALGFLVPDDEARLRQIAAQTGGSFRRAEDDGELQAAMNEVNALIGCRSRPRRATDPFKKKGSKSHKLVVPRGTRSIQFALTWENPKDKFTIGSFHLAKARKLQVRKRAGRTFLTLRLTGLKPGKLGYRVKASKLAGATTLITQASRK